MRRHLEEGDVYVHADVEGALPCIIKARRSILPTSSSAEVRFSAIDSPCECEHNNPDSLDAHLFPFVVLAVAPAVTMDKASSLSSVMSNTTTLF